MNVNVELGKKGTIGLVAGCIAFSVAVAVIAIKATKKYNKKCDDLRQNVLSGINFNDVIAKTLGNQNLDLDSSSKLYARANDLYDTINHAYSLDAINSASKSLNTLMSIVNSNDEHTVQAYAKGIELEEAKEERDYLRAVEAKKVQNEQDLAMEKYRTDRAKFTTVANAVVNTVKAAGATKVESEKIKAEGIKNEQDSQSCLD